MNAACVRRLTVSLAAALAAALVPAVAAELAADGKVVRVTVYADRAEVTREVRVDLPAGGSMLSIGKLPNGTDPGSLRVAARGVPAVLGAIELRSEAHEATTTPEFQAAEKEVKRLELEQAKLNAAESADKEVAEFLRAWRNLPAAHGGDKAATPGGDAGNWQWLFAAVRGGFDDLAKRGVERQRDRVALEEQLQVARAKLAAARGRGSLWSRTAQVDVAAQQAGALTVELTYTVSGASWGPSYRATLDAEKESVRFDADAVVTNRTGEDWAEIELSLSTAAPARGVELPELTTWEIAPIEALQRMARGKAMREDAKVVGGVAVMNDAMSAPAPAAAPPQEVDATIDTAPVVQSEYNASFAVPGRASVPADGRTHRVPLRSDLLAATLGYRSVPALDQSVFLTAAMKSPADYPLLAGTVRVMAGPTFLGEFAAEERGAGAELKLPFGRDNRVSVKRIALPREATREGFANRDKQVVQAFRTTVENLRDRKVTVVIEDRIPVSTDERVKVELAEKSTTAGWTKDPERPGIMLWTLELAPKQKKELTLEYSVRWPKDLVVPGF